MAGKGKEETMKERERWMRTERRGPEMEIWTHQTLHFVRYILPKACRQRYIGALASRVRPRSTRSKTFQYKLYLKMIFENTFFIILKIMSLY